MQPPKKPPRRTPEHVARTYLDALRAHRVRHRSKDASQQRYDESLPVAFLDLLQAPTEKEEANAFYLDLLRDVVVPEARKLRDFTSQSMLRQALGIQEKPELLAFGAILLLLRDTKKSALPGNPIHSAQAATKKTAPTLTLDQRFNRFWQGIPDPLKKDIDIARRRILGRLRFHLMVNPALQFLADAWLMSDNDADAVGFGAARIGVAGYSHLGREIVLFAILGELFGGRFMGVIERLAQPAPEAEAGAAKDADLLVLFEYVFKPLAVDLDKVLIKRETWRPDSASRSDPEKSELILQLATQSVQEVTVRGATAQAELDELIAELANILDVKERSAAPLAKIQDELERLIDSHASLQEADFDALDALSERIGAAVDDDPGRDGNPITLGEFLKAAEKEEGTSPEEPAETLRAEQKVDKNDAGRISRRLFAADPETQSLFLGVRQVIQASRSACEHRPEHEVGRLVLQGAGGEQATLEEMSRLWFGLQLRSILEERRYVAKKSEGYFGDLAEMFDEFGDAITGDALAVAMQKRGRDQFFGEKFVTVRRQFIETAVADQSLVVIKDMHLDAVREHLESLARYASVIGAAWLLEGDDAGSLVALSVWVTNALWRIDSGSSPTSPGVAAELGSLATALQSFFESYPCEYVEDGLEELDRFSVFSLDIKGVDPSSLPSVRAQLLEYLGQLERKDLAIDHEARQRYLTCALVVELINDCLALPNRDASISDVEKVQRFFSMKYAPSQGRFDQNQWLFVAYKLSQTEGFEVYRQIFERASRIVGEWSAEDPDALDDEADGGEKDETTKGFGKKRKRRPMRLSELYREILALDGFQQEILGPLEALFSAPGDES